MIKHNVIAALVYGVQIRKWITKPYFIKGKANAVGDVFVRGTWVYRGDAGVDKNNVIRDAGWSQMRKTNSRGDKTLDVSLKGR